MVLRYLYFSLHLDNDQPLISTSNASPVEGRDSVVLTCTSLSSDNVTHYTWYKNNVRINNETNQNYTLPNTNRSDDGTYACDVSTKKAPTSAKSENVTVRYLCKSFGPGL